MSNKYMDERPRCLRSGCFANYGDHCSALADNDFGNRNCPFFKTKQQLDEERAAINKKKRTQILTALRMDDFTGTHRIVR